MVKSRKVSKKVHQRNKKTKKASKMRGGAGNPNSLTLERGSELQTHSSNKLNKPKRVRGAPKGLVNALKFRNSATELNESSESNESES
jgi:hypothetical protein